MPDARPTGEPWPRGRSRHGGVDELALPPRATSAGGRLWMAGKHYVAPDVEAALSAVGADAVVCLCERFELEDRYPAYVAWLDAEGGRRAIWRPVPDLHAPPLDAAEALLGEVGGRVEAGGSVLVHCGAGKGRAGTVAAGLLVAWGADVDTAVGAVGAARPGAGPEDGSQTALLHLLAGRRTEVPRADAPGPAETRPGPA